MQNPIALFGLIALAGAATFLWMAPTAPPDRLAARARLAAALSSPRPELREAPAPSLPPPPPALRRARPRGSLTVGADGGLVPRPATLELFDYFLAARGEEPDALLSRRVSAALRERVAPGPAAEAEALWQRYLAYRDAAGGLEDAAPATSVEEREARRQRLRELRREVFGTPTAEALFAERERRERRERRAAETERSVTEPGQAGPQADEPARPAPPAVGSGPEAGSLGRVPGLSEGAAVPAAPAPLAAPD